MTAPRTLLRAAALLPFTGALAYAANPVANNVSASTPEDTATNVTLDASDADGQALTYYIGTAPTHGTATVSVGRLAVYTPAADFNGTDSFTYRVRDSSGAWSGYATATVTVTAVNDAPTATNQSVSAAASTTTNFSLSAGDVDGDTVSCSRVSSPAHGSLRITNCVASYTPTGAYTGADSFTWRASDGTTTSSTATVSITVTGSNTAPTVADVTTSTAEDTAKAITLSGSDADGDALTYAVTSSPSNGSVSIAGNIATYTPNTNWNGTDTFRYQANDGRGGTSGTALVTVSVTAVNDAPNAVSASATTAEDTATTIALAATDPDGAGLITFAVSTAPTHGSVSIVGRNATYTPTADFNGSDSFRFTATDRSGATSSPGTISMTVSAVNDPPVAVDGTLSVSSGSSGAVTLSATDVDSSSLTYSIVGNPSHGTVSLAGARATYTPTGSYSGSDSFTFQVSDGAATDTGVISVTVVGANTAPTANAVTSTGAEDTNQTINLNCTDAEGDALTYTIVRAPSHGSATLVGSRVTYTPTADWNGSDNLQYTCTDGAATSRTAIASITVTAVNDAPTATPQTVSTNEDTAVTIRLSSTDPDGPSASYTITSSPTHGSVGLVGTNATYRPEADFYGTDTFRFRASDGSAASADATVTINVTGVNDPPVITFSVGQTSVGQAVTLLAVVTDPDSSSVTWTVDSTTSYGSLSTTASGFRYTPGTGFFGVDRFTWHANDGSASSDTVTFQINVHPESEANHARMPQIGLNKIQFGLGADVGDIYSAEPQFWPENIFADFADLGVQIHRQFTRGDLVWSTLELGPGNFQDSDSNIVLGNEDFMPSATLFEIQYASPTPPWADETYTFEKYMGENAYTYLDHVIEGYSDLVSSYEVGNEMYHWVAANPPVEDDSDLPLCYPDDGYSPAEQSIFVEEASRYIKAGDPTSIITLSSINTQGAQSEDWLREVLGTAGDSDWFDIVSYHSYDSWQRTFNTRENLGALLSDLGLDNKLVRLTETGSTSDADYTDRTNYPNSDESQCADIFRLPLIGWSHGDATVIWHTYLPVTTASGGEFQGFEIVEYDGTWKKSAFAFQLLTDYLIPFKQITDLTEAGSQYVYRIDTVGGSTRYVAWGSGSWTVPSGMTRYTSVYPSSLGSYSWSSTSAGSTITLSDTPVLVR